MANASGRETRACVAFGGQRQWELTKALRVLRLATMAVKPVHV